MKNGKALSEFEEGRIAKSCTRCRSGEADPGNLYTRLLGKQCKTKNI
jgi:hypothetical protein